MNKKSKNPRRKINEKKKAENEFVSNNLDSDAYFYYIAGYTNAGFPYGITHEEYDKIIRNEKSLELSKDEIMELYENEFNNKVDIEIKEKPLTDINDELPF